MRAGFWLAAGLLALAAGCGGSSGTSSGPATTTRAAATTSAPKQLHEFVTTKNCEKLRKLGETVANALANTTGSSSLADEATALGKLADAAPSEIQGEFRTIADAFSGYAKALEDAGVTTGQTPTPAQIAKLAKAAQAIGTDKVRAAADKISAWEAASCGVKTTTGG